MNRLGHATRTDARACASPSVLPSAVPAPGASLLPSAKGALRTLLLAFVMAFVLCGCSGGQASAVPAPSSGTSGGGQATGAAFEPPAEIVVPEVEKAGEMNIDISQLSKGFVAAEATNASRLKFQVKKDDMAYNYDLPNDGTPTVYPLNMENGYYTFRIMQNTEGSNYIEIASVTADVSLASEFDPFLVPNMYCNYTAESSCVSKARELTSSATNQGEAVRNVCEYLAANIGYDTPKAEKLSTTTGYVPDPDETLSSGKGICFDYSSLAAAMLRSLGFPTKIVTGYVSPGDLYHAWIMVYADGSWHSAVFSVDPKTWSRVDVTFASSGSTAFTGDGASYADRYVY